MKRPTKGADEEAGVARMQTLQMHAKGERPSALYSCTQYMYSYLNPTWLPRSQIRPPNEPDGNVVLNI